MDRQEEVTLHSSLDFFHTLQIREVKIKWWEKDARNKMLPVNSYFSHELMEFNHRFRFSFSN